MSEELFALTEEQVDRLRALIDAFDAGELGRPQQGKDQRWLNAQQLKIGKLDAQLTAGGNAAVSIWSGDGGSETDTTENINTVYDWLLATGETVASGKKVVVALIGGVWYVIAAEC